MSIIQTNYKLIKRYGNMELINSNSEIIKDFFQSMERIVRQYQPTGKGKQTTFER